jgi:hypothetical protein
MASNAAELSSLYKQIFVMEMTEKSKDCAIFWNRKSASQYQTTVNRDGYIWTVYLTKMPNGIAVIMDFIRNSKLIYSVSSGDNSDVSDLFYYIEGLDETDKDDLLMQDIQQFVGCGPKKYYEHMHEGAIVGGVALENSFFLMMGGSVVSGGIFSEFTYNPVIAARGVRAAGTALSAKIASYVIAPAGVLGSGDVLSIFRYNPTASGGAWLDGFIFSGGTYDVIASGGVWADGDDLIQGTYAPDLVAAGVWSDGAADNSSHMATSGGIAANGSASITSIWNSSIEAFGVLANGESDYVSSIQIEPFGVLADGPTLMVFTYNPNVVAAGVRSNGSASIDAIINVIASAGVYVNGPTVIRAIFRPIVAAAATGALLDGSATVTRICVPPITAAGVYAMVTCRRSLGTAATVSPTTGFTLSGVSVKAWRGR